MPRSCLTSLQEDVLAAFFRRPHSFYLTGGAALAGFHLRHRRTADLDLFVGPAPTGPDETAIEPMTAGERALEDAANEVGAAVRPVDTYPDFRRKIVARGPDRMVVDLVLDRTACHGLEKIVINGVRMDTPEEILANKLCALLSRSEIRDVVDIRALEFAGHSLEAALVVAARKDSTLTPAVLGSLVAEIELGEDARVPGDVTVEELRAFIQDLSVRLARLAFPKP